MRRLLLAVFLLPLLAAPTSSQEPKKKREPDPLMMAKLKESQKLLEALALNKMDIAQKCAEELLRISKEAQFRKAVATAKYEYHATTFQKACETVIEKAKAKSIDGATLGYLDMTLTCVRCHQYTREEGLGFRLTAPGDGIGR